MFRRFFFVIGLLVLTGCKTTPSESYEGLLLKDGELLTSKWRSLTRFPPLYPITDAKAGTEGCTTVEYVITPDYEVKDVKVITSDSWNFSKQAKINIRKWRWSELPSGIIEQPVRTRTQFQFCLENGDGHCSEKKLSESTQCPGTDVIYAIGRIIKRSDIKVPKIRTR